MKTSSTIMLLVFFLSSGVSFGQVISENNASIQKREILDYDKNKQKQQKQQTTSEGIYGSSDQEKSQWIQDNPQEYINSIQNLTSEHQYNGQSQMAVSVDDKSRPIFLDTGNPDEDRERYEKAKQKWIKVNRSNLDQNLQPPPSLTKKEFYEMLKEHQLK